VPEADNATWLPGGGDRDLKNATSGKCGRIYVFSDLSLMRLVPQPEGSDDESAALFEIAQPLPDTGQK
jgi:hypothetical protein